MALKVALCLVGGDGAVVGAAETHAAAAPPQDTNPS